MIVELGWMPQAIMFRVPTYLGDKVVVIVTVAMSTTPTHLPTCSFVVASSAPILLNDLNSHGLDRQDVEESLRDATRELRERSPYTTVD
jgi:hypothetical protein